MVPKLFLYVHTLMLGLENTALNLKLESITEKLKIILIANI